MSTGVRIERAVDAVERATRTTSTADELLEALAAAVHKAVPHDAATWFGVDPVTMLATAPSRVEGLDPTLCDTFWHLEFHEQDTGLFADLARGDGASAMRMSLSGGVGRSSRYRDFMQPQGYDDELRTVFRTGASTWGVAGLYRESAHAAFDSDDLAVMKAIGPTVACALRIHVRAANAWLGQPSAPGLILIDSHGRITSANSEATAWMRDLWPDSVTDGGLALDDSDPGVVTSLFALVARARAVADGRERVPARLRLRDRRGRWLVLHASALSASEGANALVAVVIEAAKSAEVAPIVIEAYSLTPRERDVVGAIARGGSTAEIATELFLSAHTVRDYVKAVFEKVGVSSRGELVAKLFAEHYADPMHDALVHGD
jgi:DNA-binding CsgD family transcriptional regulator